MLEMEQNGCEAERMAKAPSHKNEVYAARYYIWRTEGNEHVCGGHTRKSQTGS